MRRVDRIKSLLTQESDSAVDRARRLHLAILRSPCRSHDDMREKVWALAHPELGLRNGSSADDIRAVEAIHAYLG